MIPAVVIVVVVIGQALRARKGPWRLDNLDYDYDYDYGYGYGYDNECFVV